MKESTSHIHRIGLIADSHGSLEALENAIRVLAESGTDCIVHLGDFFDSIHFEQISEIISLLKAYGVLTVKGNNDYQVEKMLENGCSALCTQDRRRWLSFLKESPIVRRFDDICFAHSMPYDSVRSFYDPVDTGTTDRAEGIFDNTGYHILFCGHSHAPVCFRSHSGRITRESITSGLPFGICRDQRYIFIIGSAESGECGIYDIEESQYERIRIGR